MRRVLRVIDYLGAFMAAGFVRIFVGKDAAIRVYETLKP